MIGKLAASVFRNGRDEVDPQIFGAVGDVPLLAIEQASLEPAPSPSLRELADSRARVVAAGDIERRQLEHDLHDGAQQRLLAVLLKLDVAGGLAADRPELHEKLGNLALELEAAIDELRELGHRIYPPVLANSGLAAAIESLAARYARRVTFTDERSGELPTEIEAPLYYCCLEAVRNANKHAGPGTQISIRLYTGSGELHLEVADNGRGFDVGEIHGGVGVRSMQDRVSAACGRLEINSEPGRGTLLVASVPIGLS